MDRGGHGAQTEMVGIWMELLRAWSPDRIGPDRWTDRWTDGWMEEHMEHRQAEGVQWGVCQTQTEQIGCEIDKNRWEVGQKVALGQQAGGMGGQLIVGGDGSPGWVVETTTGACTHEKLENLMKLVKKRSCWVNIWQIGDGTGAIWRKKSAK